MKLRWRPPESQRAERLNVRPWSDPRLLVGVVLVLAATVVGARVWAAADDSVQYWSLAKDVRVGDQLQRSHLVPASARLEGDAAKTYLRIEQDLPGAIENLQWSANATSGTLVAAGLLAPTSTAQSRQLPVAVADSAVPAGLQGGDRVQVWVGSGPGEVGGPAARLVLDDVRVISAGAGAGALEGASTRKILLQVQPKLLTGEVLSAVAAGYVTLVRIP